MDNFDDIRCYNDNEYQDVAKRLVKEDVLLYGLQKYHPELSIDQIKVMLLSYQTINEFQYDVVRRTLERVVDNTITELSSDGFFDLYAKNTYTFISNHRDIVLDSGLINYLLIKRIGFIGCEIAIGSNLLKNLIVRDIVRLNKSFMVKRDLPNQEMIEASKQLSNYIQHVLNVKKESVWIAQREGRAKDGNDVTNPGLLKMFCFSAQGDLLAHLTQMNITPVALSYEYDPCDAIKLPDLLAKANGETYKKQPNEDALHMATGIDGFKGNVNIFFCAPINDKIQQFSEVKNRNELLKSVASVIDTEIQGNYHLWPNNYIAYDLLKNSAEYVSKYTEKQKNTFIEYMNKKMDSVGLRENEQARQLFFEMYANPVINKYKLA
ncbi:MAG: 1-acyl-sn-glycerol-3-phosphate acyltransferase [Flavobacteriales bacterium]